MLSSEYLTPRCSGAKIFRWELFAPFRKLWFPAGLCARFWPRLAIRYMAQCAVYRTALFSDQARGECVAD
jgi:hypothetical protein